MGVDIGTVVAISKSKAEIIAKQYIGANYVGMAFKSKDDIAKTITYTVTFLKNGIEDKTDIVFNQPEDGISIVGATIENNDIVFTLSNNSKIKLTDAMITLKGEQGEQGLQGERGEQGVKGDTATDAITSERLKTPRKINGVDFDGSKDINLPLGVTEHENLNNIQGGAIGEHYHLTEKEYENVKNDKHLYSLVDYASSDLLMFEFEDFEDTEMLIKGINIGNELRQERVIIPSYYNNKKITLIASKEISGNTDLVKEFISPSIKFLEYEDSATNTPYFNSFESLETIYLPNLEEIILDCFVNDCQKLKELYIPKCYMIGGEFIKNCPNVTVYCGANSDSIIKYCIDNGIKYSVVGLPSTTDVPIGKVLKISGKDTYAWQDSDVQDVSIISLPCFDNDDGGTYIISIGQLSKSEW